MSLGPFDLAGGPFLTLYGVLLGMAVLAGFAIPRWLRPTGRSVRGVDPDAIAYLAGGSTRFVDALVARLLARRAMILEGKYEFRIVGDADLPRKRNAGCWPCPRPRAGKRSNWRRRGRLPLSSNGSCRTIC